MTGNLYNRTLQPSPPDNISLIFLEIGIKISSKFLNKFYGKNKTNISSCYNCLAIFFFFYPAYKALKRSWILLTSIMEEFTKDIQTNQY